VESQREVNKSAVVHNSAEVKEKTNGNSDRLLGSPVQGTYRFCQVGSMPLLHESTFRNLRSD